MTVVSADHVEESARRVQEKIARAAERAGRSPQEILLLGVTKTVAPNLVMAAVRAGVTLLGENYVQEARAKIPSVNAAALAEGVVPAWHLIGHLQTNKAKYCPELFSVVETVDNLILAKELAKAASKQMKARPRVLVEVNISRDTARPGVLPEEALDFCLELAQLPGLELEGLMGVAAYSGEPSEARPAFRRLRSLWEKLPGENRRMLSMGMSGDFEVAVEEGATLVRIGSAIFGARSAA